jgi:hypothetical protein
MLKVSNKLLQQYSWSIMGTYDFKINKYNDYGILKKIIKQCNQCFSLFNFF